MTVSTSNLSRGAAPINMQLSLNTPFSRVKPEELLRYYQTRRGVHFFPVADTDETRSDKIEAILDNRFQFAGETHRLGNPMDWLSNPSTDIEWHILLHKFYYAVGLGMAYSKSGDRRYLNKWIALTDSWIDQVEPGFIASDVTGRRLQNWVYAYYYFVVSNPPDQFPADFHHKLLASLQAQTNYLCDSLAPARNHRTLALYAIFLVGVVFPEMLEAADWRHFALDETVKNMDSDLLPDGVQCELSTDYHHIVLKNYLCVRRLAKLNSIDVPRRMDEHLLKALIFSMYAHKPDGIVPSLSDGDARSYVDLLHQGYELFGRKDMLYAATLGKEGHPPATRTKAFSDSGYYFMRSGWGEYEAYRDERYLIFDCGPLGAGNHGHLDLLSFEMAAYGRSLVVDPGRYSYNETDEINWRVRFRGTAYHNTVCVDGKNQTRYLPGKTKYKIKGVAPKHDLLSLVQSTHFSALCGIAQSLEYDAIHERRILFVSGEYWVISDILRAADPHRYDLLFHLSEHAQDTISVRHHEGSYLIDSPNLLLTAVDQGNLAPHIEQGFVSYRYGHKIPAPIVRFAQTAKDALFHTVMYPYRFTAPQLAVTEIPVYAKNSDQPATDAYAFRITIKKDHEQITDTCFFTTLDRRDWCFGTFSFDGSYLFIRKDGTGIVRAMDYSEGARLDM